MDVLFFNETPHVHPAVRTRSCQGSSCVLFTVSSLETQKNKPQTDWPHFPPSEQKKIKKIAPLLLPEQMAEAKQPHTVHGNKDEQVYNGEGDSRTGGACRALISIGVRCCLPGSGRATVLFWGETVRNDLAKRVWIRANNWENEFALGELVNVCLSPMFLM